MSDSMGQSVKWLFAGPLVRMFRYECLVTARGLSGERVQPRHTLVIPHKGAFRIHLVEGSAVIEANTFLYHNPGPFQSSHQFGTGDTGTSFVVPRDVLVEAIAPYDPAVVDHQEHMFAFPAASSPPRAVMLERLLLVSRDQLDELTIDNCAGAHRASSDHTLSSAKKQASSSRQSRAGVPGLGASGQERLV
jgi:hypothetical protein